MSKKRKSDFRVRVQFQLDLHPAVFEKLAERATEFGEDYPDPAGDGLPPDATTRVARLLEDRGRQEVRTVERWLRDKGVIP